MIDRDIKKSATIFDMGI